jgi:hypothetical protein
VLKVDPAAAVLTMTLAVVLAALLEPIALRLDGHHLSPPAEAAQSRRECTRVMVVVVVLVVLDCQPMAFQEHEMVVLEFLCGAVNMPVVVAVGRNLAQRTTQTTPYLEETED